MTASDYVAAHVVRWNYERPGHGGAKTLLLTIGGIAIVGNWSGELGEYFVAWAPLPKRDKQREAEIMAKMKEMKA